MGENRGFWVAFSIWCAAITLCLGMLFYRTTAAHAEAGCAPYQDLKKILQGHYNESPSGSGITDKGHAAVIVFASPDGETWTMVRIGPDGQACMIAAGSNWLEVIPPKAPIEGERPA